MPIPRKHQIIPGQPGFYHCISRCVRRAWLCGVDPLSQKNFDHRRDWLVARMRELTSCFAVDVYAYAVMSNHYHVVLYIDPSRLESLTDKEIAIRWKTLWNWRHPERELNIPANISEELIREWRNRLGDISWFMRMLNEPLARIANAEDGCKGHFWESRFKSVPLLDDAAVLACMAYVDLNPIKAGIALSVEDSDFTSIQERLKKSRDLGVSGTGEHEEEQTEALSIEPVAGREIASVSPPLGLEQYLALLRRTAESLSNESPVHNESVFDQFGVRPTGWKVAVTQFLKIFRSASGAEAAYVEFMNRTGRRRRQDASGIDRVFVN